jgi:hypothetical protein
MSKMLPVPAPETRRALASLFEKSGPVLVEVRFPSMGTTSDWYLFDDEEELDQMMQHLATGIEVRLSSVWDLKNDKGVLCLKK